MKTKSPSDFSRHLSAFLTQYLPGQKNVSPHTVASYRDAFKLFLIFCDQKKGIASEQLTLATLTKDLVTAYLDWIESERGCSIATRNQRLSAVVGFVRYVQHEIPDYLFEFQRIQGIPSKKRHNPWSRI